MCVCVCLLLPLYFALTVELIKGCSSIYGWKHVRDVWQKEGVDKILMLETDTVAHIMLSTVKM